MLVDEDGREGWKQPSGIGGRIFVLHGTVDG